MTSTPFDTLYKEMVRKRDVKLSMTRSTAKSKNGNEMQCK